MSMSMRSAIPLGRAIAITLSCHSSLELINAMGKRASTFASCLLPLAFFSKTIPPFAQFLLDY